MKALLLGLSLLIASPVTLASTPLQRLSQLVDYVSVDYPGAVEQGKIVNPTEYREMLDFAQNIQQLAGQLPASERKKEILEATDRLRDLIEQRADRREISRLSTELRHWLINSYALPATPADPPDLQLAAQLYTEQCASCHGAGGRGDGPLARGMEPAPIDFTDPERYRSRTLYGLYGVITHGVEGTEMRGFPELTDEQRWALAFHVGSLAVDAASEEKARQLMLSGQVDASSFDLKTLTTRTPAEIEARQGADAALVFGWLRRHPESLFRQDGVQSLRLSRELLQQSLAAYRGGDARRAHELAVSAYLDGFEEVEGNLDAIDRELRLKIEDAMTRLRQQIRKGVPSQELQQQIESADALLQTASGKLGSTTLSAGTAFASALLILLREGLEAILVIAALAAFLIKTDRRDGLRWLGLGVLAALLLGGLTWWASSFLEIGGAGREITEGLAALFAAAMLFYVGFWLHSKTGAAQWQAFIHGSVQKALSQGALWGLSSLAFIAVYREIFESVLFYQALWLQTDPAGQNAILGGLVVALAVLLVLAWLILKYSTRLPLRQFFSVTAWFMFVLAVVFAGKGVAALQEAGQLPIDPIAFPRIDLLGIYPTLEGLGLQLLMIVVGVLMLRHGKGGSGQARA